MSTITNKQRHKRYEFVKLCASLTKQGFNFTKQTGVSNALTFTPTEGKRLRNPYTKLPFVNSIIRVAGDKKRDCFQFEQWSGR